MSSLRHNWNRFRYAAGGVVRRVRQPRVCPSCGGIKWARVDRKGFHELLQCADCRLLYRWPYESQAEMAKFYQKSYRQSGLTTDLPNEAELQRLLAAGFRGTSKDFSRVVELFQALSIPPGARVLDFGANWGYGVWQLRQAGFDAIGYELSTPRALYGRRLGINILTNWDEVVRHQPFSVAFSSHVLEHTPNPAAAIRDQLDVLSPGGCLIACFPNGSEPFRRAAPERFHRLWGQVHPVLIGDEFLRTTMASRGIATGAFSGPDMDRIRRWDRRTSWRGTLDTAELMVVGFQA